MARDDDDPKRTRITLVLTDDHYRRLLAEQLRREQDQASKPSFADLACEMWLTQLPKPPNNQKFLEQIQHRLKMRKRRRRGRATAAAD
jgi:hypothetical protein